MARYIDADEFVKRVIQYPRQSTKTIGLALADTPTADVVERKKGKWIENTEYFPTTYTCPFCGYKIYRETTDFCPSCGADLREE